MFNFLPFKSYKFYKLFKSLITLKATSTSCSLTKMVNSFEVEITSLMMIPSQANVGK